MKILCYAKRKNGIHGFLKLVEEDVMPSQGEGVYKGKEIHFRTNMKFFEAVQRAFGTPHDSQGRELSLTMKSKPRRKELLDLIEIKRGSKEQMDALWTRLVDSAKQVDLRENIMSKYDKNCHTLVFDVLELTGLEAPRDVYSKQLSVIMDQEESPQPRINRHPF